MFIAPKLPKLDRKYQRNTLLFRDSKVRRERSASRLNLGTRGPAAVAPDGRASGEAAMTSAARSITAVPSPSPLRITPAAATADDSRDSGSVLVFCWMAMECSKSGGARTGWRITYTYRLGMRVIRR